MNRAERRSVLHSMRRAGCTCRPDIYDVPRSMWPTNARSGHFISHEPGCVLGDRVLELNQRGVVPSILEPTKRCAR